MSAADRTIQPMRERPGRPVASGFTLLPPAEQERERERWAEVQEMEGTPEEKQRAVEELMARERALMRDGEGEAPEPAGDEHPPI